MDNDTALSGILAKAAGQTLPLVVLKSRAGFYLGTADAQGPFTRESVEYWQNEGEATTALEQSRWRQRLHP